MKPVIDQAFWSDPDIEKQKAGVKLAALWLITNSKTSLLGICNTSPARFAFDTGLPPEALFAAVEALPRAFKRFGDNIFVKNYIRHQFGTGEKLTKNNFFISLKSLFSAIKDLELRKYVAEEYPDFVAPSRDGTIDPSNRDHVVAMGLRELILQRDELTCVLTGEVMAPDDMAIDHVVPRSRGGKTEAENLVAMSKVLNTKKKAKDLQEFCEEEGFDYEMVMLRVQTRALKPLRVSSKPKISTEKRREEEEGEDPARKTKARCTREEAQDFCKSAVLPRSDGDWFFDKCEGNGWKNGTQAIRDWKATIRAWKTAGYMASQKGGNGTGDHVEKVPAAFRIPMNAPPERPT